MGGNTFSKVIQVVSFVVQAVEAFATQNYVRLGLLAAKLIGEAFGIDELKKFAETGLKVTSFLSLANSLADMCDCLANNIETFLEENAELLSEEAIEAGHGAAGTLHAIGGWFREQGEGLKELLAHNETAELVAEKFASSFDTFLKFYESVDSTKKKVLAISSAILSAAEEMKKEEKKEGQ